MYFMIKDEQFFDKYMTIWGKVSNVIKKEDNCGLIAKKYLRKEKRFNKKKTINIFIYQKYCLIQFIEKIEAIIL